MNTPLLASLLLAAGTAQAANEITEQRAWTETYAVTAATPRLEVSNIWGSVQVRSGAPGRIVVSVNERRQAPDEALFARSLEQLRLDIAADAAGVSLRVGDRRERHGRGIECRGCRVDYQFDIEVPPGAIVDVGTVMDGTVEVKNVQGPVSAANVNGPVRVNGIRDCERLNSVNGEITAVFTSRPSRDCRVETINGDISLDLPPDSGLDVTLDLFNGDVRSELPVDTFSLPATVEHVVDDGRSVYRLQQLAGLRVGPGGPVYAIASMNGDLRIRTHR